MPDPRSNYSQFRIKVDGADIPETVMDKVASVSVEQNVHLPASMAITIHDASQQSPLYLGIANSDTFKIGKAVEIQMGHDQTPHKVFSGEITALEVDVRPGEPPMLVVRGYNKAHRLQRGRKSMTYLNVKDSDIASQLAGEAGLQATVDETSQVHDYVLQNNQTNWEFLQDRARRNGYEVLVEDDKLKFRKPTPTDSASVTSVLWDDLLRLNWRLTSAGQVAGVNVHGWDPQQKQAIQGTATTGQVTAQPDTAYSNANLSSPFGNGAKLHVANRPIVNQSEADTMAQAVIDDLVGNAMQVEAEIKGNPSLKAGEVIKLDKLGAHFNGTYYVTSVTHRVTGDQVYSTLFQVGGRRAKSLLELVSAGNSQQNGHGGASAMTIGVVTNNKDPLEQGRVKVKLPWFGKTPDGSSDIESFWARLVTHSSGNNRGIFWLPEVDDEVLVAFEHGDVNYPIVVGALWNGKDAPPKKNSEVLSSDGKVNLRLMKSRTGHVFTFDDTDAKQQISFLSQHGHLLVLDDTSSTENIKIKTKGGHVIWLQDNSGSEKITIADQHNMNSIVIDQPSNKITMKATGDIELTAQQNVTITGLNVSIKGNAQASVEGTASVSVKGAQASLTADAAMSISGATTSVSGTGNVTISGAMVAIN